MCIHLCNECLIGPFVGLIYDAKKCIETMGAERITREDGSTIIHYVCHCTFGIDNSIQWCFYCCDKKIINESLVEFFY